MNKNLENVCRVCLGTGSRNIFEKSPTSNDSQFSIPAIAENVSSLDRLPEKLRYVTMLKVDECENLPKSMCDSCIIQLNVAYNLKKNAIQSDMKLRQYIIEYGMSVTSYTTCSINTVSVIRPSGGMLMPANTTSASMTITTAKSTSIETSPVERRPFPVMPIIIKEEPVDYEDRLSDITVDTNNGNFDDQMQQNLGRRRDTNDRLNVAARTNGHCSSNAFSTQQQQKSTTPLPSNTMVSLNSKSLLLAVNSERDSEYISAYMPTPSSSSSDQSTTVSSTSPLARNKDNNSSFIEARQKTKKPTTGPSVKEAVTPKAPTASPTSNKKDNQTKSPDKPAEKSAVERTNASNASPKRQTRNQKEKEKPAVEKRETRQNTKSPTSHDKGSRQLRTANGSMPKMDYKSFFSSKKATPPITPKRLTVNVSRLKLSPRKNISPIRKVKEVTKSAISVRPIGRTRRSSVAHNRTM